VQILADGHCLFRAVAAQLVLHGQAAIDVNPPVPHTRPQRLRSRWNRACARERACAVTRMEPTHRYGLWRAAAGVVRAASSACAGSPPRAAQGCSGAYAQGDEGNPTPSENRATGMICQTACAALPCEILRAVSSPRVASVSTAHCGCRSSMATFGYPRPPRRRRRLFMPTWALLRITSRFTMATSRLRRTSRRSKTRRRGGTALR